MTRLLLVCAVVSGCIYADPINQRPSLDIERVGGGTEVYRKDRVDLKAVANDPEGQVVFYQWRAYACTDTIKNEAGGRPNCDAVPFYTEVLENAKFYVPEMRADVAAPAEQLLVLLEGEDEFGATAKPIQELELGVANYAPDIELRLDPRHGRVVNTTINVYAEVWDKDDGFETADISWMVFSPMTQPGHTLTEIPNVMQDPAEPTHLQLGQAFKPFGTGDWEIQVKAVDRLGKETIEPLKFTVLDDAPPCLGQWSPLATISPALPLTEPTLFQVNVVNDDLDSFPASIPPDPELQPTRFTWEILPPGAGAWQTLGAPRSGVNSVGLDPASYQPGDFVELRVEITDRYDRDLSSCGNNQTCSLTGDECIQRQTWRVEVR